MIKQCPRLTQPDVKGNTPEQVMADLNTRFDTQTTRVMFVTGLNRRIVADSGKH